MKEGWEYKIFESCLVKVPKQVQIKSKDYKKEGKFPIVSQEAELISGYWDDETIVYKHKEPVVIFGDHTKNIKYVDFNFVVGADGTHILSTKKDINPKFFYYVLKSIKLRELGYARHYKLLKEKYIPVPSLPEQQSIVDYLDSSFAKIDAMKANAEKALNEAKVLFQASLKEMLEPKEGWEEKKLIKEFSLKSGENLSAKNQVIGPYPVYGGNGITGYHNQYNLSGDQILIGRVGALCGNIHYIKERIWVTDNAFVVNNISSSWNMLFLSYELEYINLNQYASQTAQPVISNKSMKDVSIFQPPLSEQQSIVATLDSLKSKVDRLQANYEKISQECDALKQAILRQVFE